MDIMGKLLAAAPLAPSFDPYWLADDGVRAWGVQAGSLCYRDAGDPALTVIGGPIAVAGAFLFNNNESVRSISTDGSIAAGYELSAPNWLTWWWSVGTGRVNVPVLGTHGPNEGSLGFCLSADGTTIFGLDSGDTGSSTFRWIHGTGISQISNYTDPTPINWIDVCNSDGTAAAGRRDSGFAGRTHAMYWSAGTGVVSIGTLIGDVDAYSQAISADGTKVFGFSSPLAGTRKVFKWTNGGGIVDLGYVPTGGNGVDSIMCLSADGDTLAGMDDDTLSVWIWQNGIGFTDLLPAGWSEMYLADFNGLSSDGDWVFGWGTDGGGDFQMWTYQISIATLTTYGDAYYPKDISGDGAVMLVLDNNTSRAALRPSNFTPP